MLARAAGDLADMLDAQVPDGLQVRQSWNIAPSTNVPILWEQVDESGELHRQLQVARWGLLPHWAKDEKLSYKTFNARSETVTEKASFRSAVRARRCAVPADAYYEWLKEGSTKRPHAIAPADAGVITFAGLYEWWTDPQTQQTVLSTTILTGPSPEPGAGGVLDDLAGLHDRIPLPLGEELLEEWLRPGKLEKADAASLVDEVVSQAYEVAAGWEVFEVGKDVGNVRNQGPHLIEPVDSERLF